MLGSSKKTLEFVEQFIGEFGYSPTVREIAQATGMSVGAIHHHLTILAEMALLSWTPGKARTIVLPETGETQ